MWQTDLLTDAAEAAIRAREAELCAEQAVHGLDALDETALHPLLADGLARAGLGVLREQPYPQEWRLKRGRRGRSPDDVAQRRDRLRCDLVLLPEPGAALVDPMAVESRVIADRRSAAGTLFESLAGRSPAAAPAPTAAVPPEEAYWLEIKLVAQYGYSNGFSGPNRTYSGELRRTLADLGKLDEDPLICHAGLMLVVFTADQGTALHDLTVLMHACLDKGLPIGPPAIRHTPIRERIGNQVATVCLIDLRKPPPCVPVPGDVGDLIG